MPVDMLSLNVDRSNFNAGKNNNADNSSVVSSQDIQRFQEALKNFSATAANSDMVANNVNVAAAAAESMGVGEAYDKRKKSIVEKLSEDIQESIAYGSDQFQSLYHHIAGIPSADKLARGTTMLSVQLELMRATVIVDIVTKIANKAATTVDSMIRLQ
ncbi:MULTISPECIES: type III secretion system inner rod subunit SctI [Candidatus Ichthyocystis]|uniref:type III secretion system inner rod subunit SctI n=1 Tax=Candidatus Ichthyocystis TaxID=2929841 RepID=UPI000B8532A6|nr:MULTISPECIES: type III secretion system inner rod subunit SctI [Ichthyocystis]